MKKYFDCAIHMLPGSVISKTCHHELLNKGLFDQKEPRA